MSQLRQLTLEQRRNECVPGQVNDDLAPMEKDGSN